MISLLGSGFIGCPGMGPGVSGSGLNPTEVAMTTTTTTISSGWAELVPVAESLFADAERTALAGCSGLTRDAYTLDLRQYASWCTSTGCTCSQ